MGSGRAARVPPPLGGEGPGAPYRTPMPSGPGWSVSASGPALASVPDGVGYYYLILGHYLVTPSG